MMELIFAILYVTQTMGLIRCYKTAVFCNYICSFSTSIHSWNTTTSAFWKQTAAILKFHFRFLFWFSTDLPFFELDDQQQSYDITKIFQDSGRKAAIPSQIYFRLTVLWRLAFRKVKTICLSNSIRYLNPRRRYYYFRFLKTNVRHIEILPPVSILTFSL